ncbi:DUF3137 domain-containing protein [Qipengyuania gaetbuli]|uniref:DUF3137 domain-containing protein n=1 Tax=Qipengyuania gaetbuli TaxID=266952 RepID=UPI001C99B8D9|nr:DUF3137 domain-containing protein [Qipengyuania gaetbuli]MBY6014768.1 DUF3137 domain-containing protein [Qipengyuania gaetbuli]
MIEYPDADRLMAGELGEWLDGQRTTRRLAIEKSNNRIFNIAIVLLPLLGVLWVFGFSPFDIPIFVWVVAGGLAWAWTQKPKFDAKKQVKSGINEAIAKSLGLEYCHDCEGSEAFEQTRAFRMLPSHDRSSFEDMWSGHAGSHPFLLHEAHLEERRGSGKNQRWVTVFRGAILSIGFEERFHGTTLLAPDGQFSKFFGGAKDTIKVEGAILDRAQMVSPEFEDRYDVYSTDQTEARWMMHPEYIERLLAMESAFGGRDSSVLFTGGTMVMAINGGDMFESGSLDHHEDAHLVRETIRQFAQLADAALALNRIRSDQVRSPATRP